MSVYRAVFENKHNLALNTNWFDRPKDAIKALTMVDPELSFSYFEECTSDDPDCGEFAQYGKDRFIAMFGKKPKS